MRILFPGLLLGVLPATAASQAQAPDLPTADSVRALVARRVADPRVPGLAIGRLAGSEILKVTGGRRRAGSAAAVDASTGFEVGSITKAFTGLLLADMVLRAEVGLDDPVERHLPPGTRVPSWEGTAITLRHLATHTSGLPRLPDNMAPADPEDPYADYDAARLTTFLAGHRLRRAPGTQYEYSNLGAGLLGWALATRAGMSYEDLLRSRIFRPLGMRNSTTASDTGMASGHDLMGQPKAPWHLDVLAGAGAIRSTLDDMLRFAQAAHDTTSGPLARAMALSQRQHFRVDSITSIGLGWHRRTVTGRTQAWHNGGTGGFRSMLVADPGLGRAAVVLVNSLQGHDALGMALLDRGITMPPLPAARATVTVDSATLARYPGRYRLAPSFVITILPRGSNGIDLQATGQPRFRLYASSAVDFFITEVEASITFETDATGRVVALVLHQNGAHQRALREP
jgi:CubicO group peptidase (beta-lactamase class C family)